MNRSVTRIVCAAAAGIAVNGSGLAEAGAAGAAPARSFGPSASLPVFGFLNGVAATSARNVWAVGGTNGGKTLIVHWNGSAWRRVPSPPLQAAYSPPWR